MKTILSAIDGEISRLQEARNILQGQTIKKAGTTRHLSEEGRKRIAEAVKRRWRLQKQKAAKAN